VDLKSTDFERWQYSPQAELATAAPRTAPRARVAPTAPVPPTTVPPAAAAPPPGPAPIRRERFRFLTADGQSATPLEQEALLGTNDLVEANFLDRCELATTCIGRLRFDTPRGRGFATGFMVAPGLLMTNHHVFPDESIAQGAVVEFGYRYNIAGLISPTVEFALRPEEFFINSEALDFAVVAVAPVSGTGASLADRGYLRLNPDSGKAEEKDFVTIIQHPDGQPMQIALRENEVVRAQPDENFIWYRADTAHGSSGAPVLNDSFQIAALHASGRIKRAANNEFLLKDGRSVASLEGLKETDVVWEANVGMRVSHICVELMALAKTRSASHANTLAVAMKGGDILATAIARAKAGVADAHGTEAEATQGSNIMPVSRVDTGSGARSALTDIVVPLQLRISIEVAGGAGQPLTVRSGRTADGLGLETEAAHMLIPVIFDGLDERGGFDRKFLGLAGNASVPMPTLTNAGKAVAAPLLAGHGSGVELKYHKFSIWMHKERRLALFTASNVDWRARKKSIDGKKLDRDTLAGFPPDSKFVIEQWVADPRLAPEHQLPDIFYTDDRKAFDKGHLVRRDDVCWGDSFADIQKGNGDTYHVTNCSPQIKPFNQGAAGVENWGDLESHVQKATKKDNEEVVIYAGPFLGADDRLFRGKDDAGSVRIQIPNRFWKIVVTKGDNGPEAYGFILSQDVRSITETEFFVTDEWKGSLKRLSEIEGGLRGWISLDQLKPFDQFDKVQGH
jgi:endonuclease G, mitochondrial